MIEFIKNKKIILIPILFFWFFGLVKKSQATLIHSENFEDNNKSRTYGGSSGYQSLFTLKEYIMKIKLLILTIISLTLVISTPLYAADRICQEDFEGISVGPLPEIAPTDEISRAARPFWGTDLGDVGGIFDGIGNPGKAANAHVGPYTNNVSYSEPKFRFDNKFNNSKEVYVKFDIRIDPNLGTSYANREIGNFKLIRITDYQDAGAASSAEWHPQINFAPSSSSYSFYTWSEGGGYGEYYFHRAGNIGANHLMDNVWHTIEIYMNIGTAVVVDKYDASADGIVRIWEDGNLILEDTSVPFRSIAGEGQGINSIAFIRHAKELGAPVTPMNGNIYFDNLEVWDGMPDAQPDTTPPSHPTGLGVS